jgi:uncharacterized protein (DUF2384 family)
MNNSAAYSGLNAKDVHEAFGIVRAKFIPDADALARIDKTFRAAMDVFRSSGAAKEWMLRKAPALDNEAPLHLSGQSKEGPQKAFNVLESIKRGPR